MAIRSFMPRAAAVVLCLLTAHVVVADPPSISGLSSATRLSADERTLIDEYARWWVERLGSAAEKPDGARAARRELVEPLRRGNPSEVFRDQYGRALLEGGLDRLVAESNGHVGVTAVIVTSQIGTEQALDTLLGWCALDDEPRRHIRLAAARGCKQLLGRRDRAPLSGKDHVAAARSLHGAARVEPDFLTLRYQVEAILAAAETAPPDAVGEVREFLVRALDAAAERAAANDEPDPAGLLGALYPVVNALRMRFIELTLADQKSFGQQLGPCLGRLLDVADVRWAELQAAGAPRERLGNLIYLCERFLSIIDTFVRNGTPPSTALKEAWDSRDAARYKRDLQQWSGILGRAPYRTR